MKLFKKFVLAILITISTLVIAPVVVPDMLNMYTVQAASVKINKTKKTLYVGNTYNLKITGTKNKVKWSTSNKKIATVSSKGKVTAKKKGTVTITAKVGKKKYKCKITVKTPSINKESKTLSIGEGYTLKVNGVTSKIKWSSNNTKIATVNSSGRVTAKKKGTATITAKVGKKKYKCKITVKEISFSNVTVTPTKMCIATMTGVQTGNVLLLTLKNNNDYAVDIRIEATFYDSKGKKVGTGDHYNFALESKAESIMNLYCYNKGKYKNFSTYKLSLGKNNNANNKRKVTKVTDKRYGASMIKVTNVKKEKNQYTVKIQNKNISSLGFINVGIVYYDKNGKIIDARSKSVSSYYMYPNQYKDLTFEFPKNNKGKYITPASYKIYVNYAYQYINR